MAKQQFEIEEKEGGYVRNGDILEWQWKNQPAEEAPPADSKKAAAKEKPRR